jgi:hypothetical protein
MSTQPSKPKVASRDRGWVTPEVADEVLKRAQDGSKPVQGKDLAKELAEMDRLGL